MTTSTQPPTVGAENVKLKQRVTDLERLLKKKLKDVAGITITFNHRGALVIGAESDPFGHPFGAKAIYVTARLKVTGSTSTLVSLRRNGVEFKRFTIGAGTRTYDAALDMAFQPSLDELTVASIGAGIGAQGLVVTVVFDR